VVNKKVTNLPQYKFSCEIGKLINIMFTGKLCNELVLFTGK